jgi:hypothetical protein
LLHATVAWRVIFLPATISLLLDSQFARILLSGFWRRPAARYQSLRHFLSPLTGITAASSLGISTFWWVTSRIITNKMSSCSDGLIYLQLDYTFTLNYTYIQAVQHLVDLHNLPTTVAHALGFV